ncbi:glycosyltransferase [Candidatus Margulisiibacteriota bacterium]
MDGKVSVIMTSFNHGKYIAEAIDSVVDQTYKNWELVIVDDGSNDDSVKIIKGYVDGHPNIKLYVHPGSANKGIPATHALALSKISGEYVAYLESDDIWDKHNLELKIAAFRKHPEVAVIYNDLQTIVEDVDADSKAGYVEICRRTGGKYREPFIATRELLERNIVPTFSVAATKSELLRKMVLPENHKIWLDWWLWNQMAIEGKFLYLSKRLTKWRIHKSSGNQQFVGNIDHDKYLVLYKKDLLRLLMRKILRVKGVANKLAVIVTSMVNYCHFLSYSLC